MYPLPSGILAVTGAVETEDYPYPDKHLPTPPPSRHILLCARVAQPRADSQVQGVGIQRAAISDYVSSSTLYILRKPLQNV